MHELNKELIRAQHQMLNLKGRVVKSKGPLVQQKEEGTSDLRQIQHELRDMENNVKKMNEELLESQLSTAEAQNEVQNVQNSMGKSQVKHLNQLSKALDPVKDNSANAAVAKQLQLLPNMNQQANQQQCAVSGLNQQQCVLSVGSLTSWSQVMESQSALLVMKKTNKKITAAHDELACSVDKLKSKVSKLEEELVTTQEELHLLRPAATQASTLKTRLAKVGSATSFA